MKKRKVTFDHRAIFVAGRENTVHINHCSVCRKLFKSRSHSDVLCDLCWADNEMRPYQFGRPLLRAMRRAQ